MEFLPSPGVPFSIAMFIVAIGVLVTVHELGHYLAGRWFGVHATDFSIGMGPEIAGWTDGRGTRWKVGALPIGGYVKFFGDMNAASQPSPEWVKLEPEVRARAFPGKPLWQRAIIIAAGPLINFAFAILIFTGLFATYGAMETAPVAATVERGSPAAAAGIRPGDRFVRVDGERVRRFEDLKAIIVLKAGQPLPIEIERDGRTIALTVTPARAEDRDSFGNTTQVGRFGVGAAARASTRVQLGLGSAFVEATSVTVRTIAMTPGVLWQIITGERSVKELGGPIKIAKLSGEQASLGIATYIGFIAFISINLGFMNLLPIPMLDGGHLMLYAAEAVRRRPLDPKVMERAFMAGFALVVTFMVFVTGLDLASLGVWQRVAGLLG